MKVQSYLMCALALAQQLFKDDCWVDSDWPAQNLVVMIGHHQPSVAAATSDLAAELAARCLDMLLPFSLIASTTSLLTGSPSILPPELLPACPP